MGSATHCWQKDMMSITICSLLLIVTLPCSSADSAANYQLTGPVISILCNTFSTLLSMFSQGLSPDKIVLPCRYFFVERRLNSSAEDDGKRYDEKDLKVAVEGVREGEGGPSDTIYCALALSEI